MTDKPHESASFRLDKRLVRRSFERAAASYDAAAFLQQAIADRLVARLDEVLLTPATVLDVGAGTGYLAAAVRQRYPASRLLVTDLALAMLETARERLAAGAGLRERAAGLFKRSRQCSFIASDAERLPLADRSVDLVVSNLALQWCPDLDRALTEFRRVLVPGGLLMFTTFGPDTLKELRAAWSEADGYTHVNAFIDMHDIGDALMRAGLGAPVMDVEKVTVTYPEVRGLMQDLKAIGAHNVAAGRPPHLSGRQRLARMTAAYERWRRDGVLPASYEVVYGHAWADERKPPAAAGGAVTRVSLDAIGRRSKP